MRLAYFEHVARAPRALAQLIARRLHDLAPVAVRPVQLENRTGYDQEMDEEREQNPNGVKRGKQMKRVIRIEAHIENVNEAQTYRRENGQTNERRMRKKKRKTTSPTQDETLTMRIEYMQPKMGDFDAKMMRRMRMLLSAYLGGVSMAVLLVSTCDRSVVLHMMVDPWSA